MNQSRYENWTLNYLSPEAEQGRTRGGSLLCEASRIAAGCHKTGATDKSSEPVNRKERAQFNELVRQLEEAALSSFAEEKGYFVSEDKFLAAFAARKIGEGAEQ